MKLKIIFFILVFQNVFCQEKYHFDNYLTSHVKNYQSGYDDELIEVMNRMDSTLLLVIQIKGDKKIVTLNDLKKEKIFIFNMDFKFKNLKSLKKLDSPVKFNKHNTKKIEDSIGITEVAEFENDTIKNTKIVHLTKFLLSDKTKIYREYFYFFEIKKEFNFEESLKLKLKLNKKFNIEFKEDENLYKILSLKEGKILIDTEFKDYVNEEFDLNFVVDEEATNNLLTLKSKIKHN
ncbi:hypothetical protein OX283_006770 [Flavobacterium sp. SUN052]|uniref:hypothetical protein n=1 Tax=Flavobacterium sp. SUN052 TaxID=3002441 RepID=UPI00237DC87E|nr:hypothetical protein [Flavobacterium sp. SUN052]MEC4004352.1 hypothetical protein [Flavobacterium sp. SUN052]